MEQPVVLFDGVCNLCNGAVKFIIRHDKKKVFLFASLQSEAGQKLLGQYNFPADEHSTSILIDKGKAYTRSTGSLMVEKKLNGLWPVLYSYIIIPAFIRDSIYNWISTNRYKWFGKKETCIVPTPELKARFLN